MTFAQNYRARNELKRMQKMIEDKAQQLLEASNAAAGPDNVLCTKAEFLQKVVPATRG